MTQPKYISVSRFVKLMEMAEEAAKSNDLGALEAMNAEIEQIGYRVIVRDGKTLIQQMYYNPATGRFEVPPPKPGQNAGTKGA